MAGYDLRNVKVMIVDDTNGSRLIMRQVLASLGVSEVIDVPGGVEAMERLRQDSVDLIFTDYKMVPIDGIELTRFIRAGNTKANPYTPIIMVSGYTEVVNITKARDAGVTEFLAKPFSAKLVYMRIKTVIESPRPFVKVGGFFGPDRRRRLIPQRGGDKRRSIHHYAVQERKEDR